jgi:hypothetical protein
MDSSKKTIFGISKCNLDLKNENPAKVHEAAVKLARPTIAK